MSFGHSYLEIKDFPSSFSVLSESVCSRLLSLIGTISKDVQGLHFLWCHFLYSKVYM